MRIATMIKGSAAVLVASVAFATTPARAQQFGPYIPDPNYGPGEVIYGQGIAPHQVVSPAERRGIVEGELYEEYGIAPNHQLSPAEMRGFGEGERVDEGFGQVLPPF